MAEVGEKLFNLTRSIYSYIGKVVLNAIDRTDHHYADMMNPIESDESNIIRGEE